MNNEYAYENIKTHDKLKYFNNIHTNKTIFGIIHLNMQLISIYVASEKLFVSDSNWQFMTLLRALEQRYNM